MTNPPEDKRQPLVLPSLSPRNLSGASKNHLTGFFVISDGMGLGRVVGAESHFEFNFGLCLATHPDTSDLQEQVRFEWRDTDGDLHDHFFDFVVTCTDGARIAYTVKPLVWNRGTFADNIPHIAQQARASGQFSDVRLLSDADLDQVSLFNAKLLHACRAVVPDHDATSMIVVRNMDGMATMRTLVEQTGLKGDGFRAMVRLIRSRHLRLRNHEHISYDALLYKAAQP
jgi:hypothetical protein